MIKIEVYNLEGTCINRAILDDSEVLTFIEQHRHTFGPENQYTIISTDITAELAQQRERAEALKYLTETDWLIIREWDSGVPCPIEIKQAREAARQKI